MSLPSWERGLKYLKKLPVVGSDHVAPLVGAWIEITECDITLPHFLSLPSWERGLTEVDEQRTVPGKVVAPLVGAWIEIFFSIFEQK